MCVCFAMLFSEDRPACFTREVRTFLVKWVILAGLSEGSGLVKSFSLQPGSGSGDVWESPHIDRSTKVCVCVLEDDWLINKAITSLQHPLL